MLAVSAAAGLGSCASSRAATVPTTFRVENVETFPSAQLAVANRVGAGNRTDVAAHPTVTFRVRLTSGTQVRVTGLDLPPGWSVAPGALPASATAARPLDLQVTMDRTGTAGLRGGPVTVHTTSSDEPRAFLRVRGYEQEAVGGTAEPSLQSLVQLFGWTTKVTAAGQQLQTRGAPVLVGDEVRASGFAPARAGTPVTVRQLAAFHRLGTAASLSWRPRPAAESATTVLLTQRASDSQTVLPLTAAGTAAVVAFDPRGPFALVAQGQDSDDRRNDSSVDRSRYHCTGTCGHHVRSYPVLDGSGRPVPGELVVAVDYNQGAPGTGVVSTETGNGDYQDAVYLLTSVVPVAG